MIETKKTVVLHDGRRVELPAKEQLWEVQLTIACLDDRGKACTRSATQGSVHVTRATLGAHGLIPDMKSTEPTITPAPTAEDLILELLECVGVFPAE